MATYIELYDLAVEPDAASAEARKKVSTAVKIAAQAYLSDGASTTAQRSWAANATADRWALIAAGERVWPLVLAANSGASVAAILSASDAAVQANVDAVVAQLADADGAV